MRCICIVGKDIVCSLALLVYVYFAIFIVCKCWKYFANSLSEEKYELDWKRVAISFLCWFRAQPTHAINLEKVGEQNKKLFMS